MLPARMFLSLRLLFCLINGHRLPSCLSVYLPEVDSNSGPGEIILLINKIPSGGPGGVLPSAYLQDIITPKFPQVSLLTTILTFSSPDRLPGLVPDPI